MTGPMKRAEEIIRRFRELKETDPAAYYNAMGYGDEGVNVMDDFIGDAYALGLVAGALYALDHFAPAPIPDCPRYLTHRDILVRMLDKALADPDGRTGVPLRTETLTSDGERLRGWRYSLRVSILEVDEPVK